MPLHLFALRPLIAAGALACGLIAPTWAQTPPPAPSHPVTETLHGVTLVDPYRNLETRSPETLAWMRAQAAYAAQTLDGIPLRQPLLKRIEQLAQTTGDAVGEVLRMPGERYYYLKRRAGENQFKLVMRSGLAGAEQVLVDPEALARRPAARPTPSTTSCRPGTAVTWPTASRWVARRTPRSTCWTPPPAAPWASPSPAWWRKA
jgi:prolyl oligopeptidase